MALVLAAAPEETAFEATITGSGHTHILNVVWRTPDSSEVSKINRLGLEVNTILNRLKKSEDEAVSLFDKLEESKATSRELIRTHFIRLDDAEYEDGDLDRMLEHENYTNGLLSSLVAVSRGDAGTKNGVTLGTSGQPETSPAKTPAPA